MRIISGGVKIIADLLYPPRCPVCHGIAPAGRPICPGCVGRLPFVTGPRCRKCGKPAAAAGTLCRDCAEIPHAYDLGAGVFLYDAVMRKTVSWFKYKGRQEYGRILGRIMAEAARPFLIRWSPDVIVPVPVHRERRRRRGYNQAEILAESLSAATGIPAVPELLVRTVRTEAMKNLSREERRRNTARAFAAPGRREMPGRVLIVDDIYTTGATVDGCAGALKAGGAGRVFFLAMCIGGGALSQL